MYTRVLVIDWSSISVVDFVSRRVEVLPNTLFLLTSIMKAIAVMVSTKMPNTLANVPESTFLGDIRLPVRLARALTMR
jgi:hypothetical protein